MADLSCGRSGSREQDPGRPADHRPPAPSGAHDPRRHGALGGALIDGVQDQLAAMRHRELGRDIGRCERCGELVRSQHGFIRQDGHVAHVRCRPTIALPPPAPPGR